MLCEKGVEVKKSRSVQTKRLQVEEERIGEGRAVGKQKKNLRADMIYIVINVKKRVGR